MQTYGAATRPEVARPVWQSIRRGIFCRCPNCGRGALFTGFLKVNRICGTCGEELFHHRADDFPPYLTMVIAGHIAVFAMLDLEIRFAPDPLTMAAIFVPGAVALCLLLLRPVKGGIVGLQWSLRMHGFGGEKA
jgi:uncharacterized protein (DUF983 family)